MTIINANKWIPVEHGDEVLTHINQSSAAENSIRRANMTSDLFEVPKMGQTEVHVLQKEEQYPTDTPNLDTVALKAYKFGSMFPIAWEDSEDARPDLIKALQLQWAGDYASKLDNAVFGTTAAKNGDTVPFDSFYTVAQDAGSYTATAGNLTFDQISDAFGAYEESKYYAERDSIIVASPAFKQALRGLTDANGNHIFIESVSVAQPSTILGVPVQFSSGLRTSATAEVNPAGNPLMFIGSKNAGVLGVRSGPEFQVSTDAQFETDTTLLKARSRRGFAVCHEGFSMLELTTA